MRLVTVKAPLGSGKEMAEIAFTYDITEVSLAEQNVLSPKEESIAKKVLDL